jgi:hypothetical protein
VIFKARLDHLCQWQSGGVLRRAATFLIVGVWCVRRMQQKVTFCNTVISDFCFNVSYRLLVTGCLWGSVDCCVTGLRQDAREAKSAKGREE